MNLISIDPGANECYVCVWRGDRCISAFTQREPLQPVNDLVVCEIMQVYPGGRYAADLLQVQGRASRVTALYAELAVHWVPPSTWKGQVPKKIHQATRIMPHISEVELALFRCVEPSDRHNFVDAFGIGMWFLRKHGLWTRG